MIHPLPQVVLTSISRARQHMRFGVRRQAPAGSAAIRPALSAERKPSGSATRCAEGLRPSVDC